MPPRPYKANVLGPGHDTPKILIYKHFKGIEKRVIWKRLKINH